jgi:hypothetical protein
MLFLTLAAIAENPAPLAPPLAGRGQRGTLENQNSA